MNLLCAPLKQAGKAYHNLSLDFALAAESGLHESRIITPAPRPAPLKYFSIVGAMFTSAFEMYDKDRNTILDTLEALQEAGLPIDDQPEFRFYNLLAPIHADFLREVFSGGPVPRTDVMIANYLFGKSSHEITIDKGFSQEQINETYDNFRYMYSDHHFRRGNYNREVSISTFQADSESAWAHGCEQAGVKVVVTRANDDAIDTVNTEHLARRDYFKTLISNAENFPAKRYYMGKLGFSLSPGAIRDYAPIVNPNHLLGERLIKLAR